MMYKIPEYRESSERKNDYAVGRGLKPPGSAIIKEGRKREQKALHTRVKGGKIKELSLRSAPEQVQSVRGEKCNEVPYRKYRVELEDKRQ